MNSITIFHNCFLQLRQFWSLEDHSYWREDESCRFVCLLWIIKVELLCLSVDGAVWKKVGFGCIWFKILSSYTYFIWGWFCKKYSISTGGTLPCELKYIRMPLIDHQVCQNTQTGKLYQMVSGRPYPDIQICAGFLNGTKDACQVK